MASTNTLAILRSLRSLVGSAVFNEAVTALQTDSDVVAPATVKKERKAHSVDPEKSAKRSADMTALQSFIKHVRAEAGEGAVYKEVQKDAGARWKAMTEEEKTAWKAAHPSEETTRAVSVSTTAEPKAKATVKAVKASDAPTEVKKAGRPKKE